MTASYRWIFALLMMLSIVLPSELAAQGRNFYGFRDFAHGHAKIGLAKPIDYAPDDFYADIRGGYIDIFVAKGNCSDKYRFSWTFEADMTKLEPGQVYPVRLKAERIEGTCRQNEAWGMVQGSNDKCALCEDTGLPGPAVTLAVKPLGDARAYAVPDNYNKESTYEISVSRVAEEETHFFLSFSCTTNPSPRENFDYQVVYRYGKNYQPQTGAVGFDCHMLYGIGTNLAFLEKGAEAGDAAADLLPFLNAAIKHVTASGCLDPAWLNDLKKRLATAGDTRVFHEEIKRYREQVPSLISSDCID